MTSSRCFGCKESYPFAKRGLPKDAVVYRVVVGGEMEFPQENKS